MFSQLPNNLIMNIIKMNTIQEEKEKKIRKDIFSKCMNEINEVPYTCRRYFSEEYRESGKCVKPRIFSKVCNEFWECYNMSVMNGTNYDTGESSEEDDSDEDFDDY